MSFDKMKKEFVKTVLESVNLKEDGEDNWNFDDSDMNIDSNYSDENFNNSDAMNGEDFNNFASDEGFEEAGEDDTVVASNNTEESEKQPEQNAEENVVIINKTPHPVTLYKDGEPFKTFEPESPSPRLVQTRKVDKVLKIDGVDINLNKTEFSAPYDLPEPQPNTLYIVSALLMNGVEGRDDLIVPDEAIRDSDNRIIGCNAFARK